MKSLSIVIVTWNCRAFVKECLESLDSYRQDPQTEVIIVDNASSDGTPQLIRGNYPDVVLIESDENLGFPRGNNVGIRKSSGEYLCLINPDVKVLDGCIETMLAQMQRDSRIGLLGPGMLGADGKLYRSYMGAPTLWTLFCRALALDTLFPRSSLFGGFLMFYFEPREATEVDILNGWFWMTRREALEEVGLLDEEIFMYADDLDWSKRFRDAGWKVIYLPEAKAIHYGGGTTARAPVRFSVEMQRANFQYWRKNYGATSQFVYLAIASFHQVARLIGYSLLFLIRKSRREEATAKIKRSFACLQWALRIGQYGHLTARTVVQSESN